MLYYRCPSCRTILADKQIPHEIGLKQICDNDKLSDEQKNEEKKELLNKLHIINQCCRMRILTYVKKIDLLK